jgi:preprotein translocase subunit SecG
VKGKIEAKNSMNVMYRVAILILAVIVAILLVVAIYMYINKPIGYGITGIAFGYTRYSSVIKVAVENNKSESITVVVVFINGSQINNEPSASFPYPYPKLPVTIQPFSRTVLQIEGFDWKWPDPPRTTYTYEITLVADDGTVFTKSKETPPVPR